MHHEVCVVCGRRTDRPATDKENDHRPDPPAAGEGTDNRPEQLAGHDMTSRELAVIRLLAGGLDDRRIARRLNIGTRTVHRDVARVMVELGVRTRFAAGVEAVRRGLVTVGGPCPAYRPAPSVQGVR